MKNEEDKMKKEEDVLKRLFSQMPLEKPSPNFQKKLMIRIEAEAIRKEKRQERIGSIIASVTSALLIGLTCLAFSYFENFPTFADLSVELPTMERETGVFYVMIGVISLVLLIADDLIRCRLQRKKE